jgi:hypothetical protein
LYGSLTLHANSSCRNPSLVILNFFQRKNSLGKFSTLLRFNYLGKNPVGIIPWEKFQVHSTLVPSKIYIANISRVRAQRDYGTSNSYWTVETRKKNQPDWIRFQTSKESSKISPSFSLFIRKFEFLV